MTKIPLTSISYDMEISLDLVFYELILGTDRKEEHRERKLLLCKFCF